MTDQKVLYILTPCFGGNLTHLYVQSLTQSIATITSQNIHVFHMMIAGDSLISRARNNILAKALYHQHTHFSQSKAWFVFIDADLEFQPADLIRLMNHDLPIVGGVYAKKAIHWDRLTPEFMAGLHTKWSNNPYMQNGGLEFGMLLKLVLCDANINWIEPCVEITDNVCSVKHLATGFMMLSGSLLHRLVNEHPELAYVDDTGFLQGDENHYARNFFTIGLELNPSTGSNQLMSEDWWFCNWLRKLNVDIKIDIACFLQHVGTMAYPCHLATNLLLMQPTTPQTEINSCNQPNL